MREIKFRVHDADTGEVLAYEHFNTNLNWGYFWLDAKELAEEGEKAICHAPPEYFKHPQPLGRLIRVLYIGRKDKNGKEIYHSDLVKGWNGVVYQVVWQDGRFLFHDFKAWGRGYYDAYLEITEMGQIENNAEVIGNIWENPELIEDIKELVERRE